MIETCQEHVVSKSPKRLVGMAAASAVLALLGARSAAAHDAKQSLAPVTVVASTPADYRIGAGDTLLVWVWKNADLTADMPVRPDGKISTPLVQDVQAQGKTPTEVAADLRERLSTYIQEPVVTVLVKGFALSSNSAAIHIIGAAATPKTISYRAGITALDVLVEAGGLSTFANGDGAKLIRAVNGAYQVYPLRLKRLIKAGDLTANVELMPGDTIRIPERWF